MRAVLGILLVLLVAGLSGCVVCKEYAIDCDGTQHLEAVWVRSGTTMLNDSPVTVYSRVWARKH